MDQDGLTSKFSVCLKLDHQAMQAVDAIRKTLAPSPYRDDTPHITLLRTIKTPVPMSDTDLLQDMERLLGLSKNLPLTATVDKPVNRFSPLFRMSSLITLHTPPELIAYRKHMLKVLQANNYSVGLVGRMAFLPHVTVRLGIPYTDEAKVMAKQSFSPNSTLTFNAWIILRDIKKGGKYLVKEIAP